MIEELPIGEIIIGPRGRTKVEHLEMLAQSLRTLGMLHPVVVNERNELIAGFRRLKAAERCGWATVPVRRVSGLEDALKALTAEMDENTCREPLGPGDIVEMGKRIEALERPAAKARSGMRTDLQEPSGKLPEGSTGQVRDKVGAALGVSGRTYEKAKAVVAAAETEPERFGDLPAKMEAKSIDAAHRELKERRAPTPVLIPRPTDPTSCIESQFDALTAAVKRAVENGLSDGDRKRLASKLDLLRGFIPARSQNVA